MDWFLFPVKLHPMDSGIGRGLGMLPTVSPKDLGVCGRTVWHTGPALSQQDNTETGNLHICGPGSASEPP